MSNIMSAPLRGLKAALMAWIDSDAYSQHIDEKHPHRINWLRCVPFLFLHLACVGIVWVGWSPIAMVVCLAFFWLRMFAITGFYHRLFAHRSFKTNRFWQFIFAVLGNSSCQRGPLWWAAFTHRYSTGFGLVTSAGFYQMEAIKRITLSLKI